MLVVAEAPSTGTGRGATVAPGFEHVSGADRLGSPLRTFSEFIRNTVGGIPYFTDAVKCGVGSVTGGAKQKLLSQRFEKCSAYLAKEIEIISPCLVIAVGTFAYGGVCEIVEKMVGSKRPAVVKLLHYSRNASLPVSDQEKADIVWPLQLRGYFPTEVTDADLGSLNALNT